MRDREPVILASVSPPSRVAIRYNPLDSLVNANSFIEISSLNFKRHHKLIFGISLGIIGLVYSFIRKKMKIHTGNNLIIR